LQEFGFQIHRAQGLKTKPLPLNCFFIAKLQWITTH
jgi:hypothetical protein